MAVDRKQFSEIIDKGLKANKEFTKFYLNFKLNNKSKQKVLDYSKKHWDKRTRISNAKAQLASEKNKEESLSVNFTENSSLNSITELYFSLACDDTEWSRERKATYELYCSEGIGKKKIKLIRQVDIDALRKSMERRGHSKQTENGCSPRTIKKVLIQVLKPILVYALDNKVINDIPTIKVPKQTRQKKTVNHASEKLATLFRTITSIYKDDPFYRALFLFALYGRRWNEIRTLTWEDIDLKNNLYTIRAENNKIDQNQTYELPVPILEAISHIHEQNSSGLIFKSPKTDKELHPPKRQLERIKTFTNIPELTMHYFRHIVVSAMGESGTATTVLSAALGHTNLDTVNNFYLSANHQKASFEANQTIAMITNRQGE